MFPDAFKISIRGPINDAVQSLVINYGFVFKAISQVILQAILFIEWIVRGLPWWLVVLVFMSLTWQATRKVGLVAIVAVLLFLVGALGLWDLAMQTLALMLMATLISVAIGVPMGIWLAKSRLMRNMTLPVLDVMQTMPSFVYLIPVVMLLGIGRVPGLIAVVIYAIPPMIRLTNLGIRLVDRDILEAADAFGSSGWQRLLKVQLPLALPTIMAGVNQTIMMALAMVVVAAMIGVQGLGQPVLKAIANQYFTLGIFNGLAIVGIAVIFDRVSQAYGKRLQKHQEVVHG